MDAGKQQKLLDALDRLHKDARGLAAVAPGEENDYAKFVARIDADNELLNAAIVTAARDSSRLMQIGEIVSGSYGEGYAEHLIRYMTESAERGEGITVPPADLLDIAKCLRTLLKACGG